MQFMSPLLNSLGNKNMNVNGSVTPVEFKFTASAPLTNVISMGCILDHTQSTVFKQFLDTLKKGILIETFKTPNKQIIGSKTDLVSFFNHHQTENLHSSQFIGTFMINHGSPLILQQGESIKVTIQDDLTSLVMFSVSIQAVE